MTACVALSIVVPVFNEQESISLFLERARPAVRDALALIGKDATAEYLFVDDGSSDRTRDILAILAKLNDDVHYISLSRNFGKEAALAAGIDRARGDAVVPIDVDLQDPPEVIVPMARLWLGGAQVVNARRSNRSTDSRLKRWSALAFYRTLSKLADYPIPENVGDFRLLDRQAVDAIKQLSEHTRFNKGLFSWVGFRIATVDYEREVRGAGTNKWRLRKLWGLALDGITSSTTTPLRIWSYLGGLIAIMAFAYAVGLIVKTVVTGADTPGYASIMVAVLMLGGLNLMSLGIIGEYLGRVAQEVRRRPLYVVAEASGDEASISPFVTQEQAGDDVWIAQPIRA